MQNKHFTTFAAAIFILPSFFVPFLTTGAVTNTAGATGSAGNSIAPNSPAGAGTSLNWAGYESTGGTYTSVVASWTIPDSAAPAGASTNTLSADATWVGIGGVTSRDLIQAGTQTVFQNGQNGSPSYEAWYETLPSDSQQIPLTVHPGDAMTVSITQQSAGQWNISFFDGTTGQSYNTSVSYQSSLSSAEWIEEMPSATRGFVALDDFGTASFTNGFTVENGTQLSLTGANAEPLTMINGTGAALATPSSLGADGASFSITRTSVAASTAAVTPEVITGRGGYGNGNGTNTGRWSRTGVGVQGYTPPTRTTRTAATSAGNGFGYFHIGLGNFPNFFRTFENNFRDERNR